jgi:hypothetical protein
VRYPRLETALSLATACSQYTEAAGSTTRDMISH